MPKPGSASLLAGVWRLCVGSSCSGPLSVSADGGDAGDAGRWTAGTEPAMQHEPAGTAVPGCLPGTHAVDLCCHVNCWLRTGSVPRALPATSSFLNRHGWRRSKSCATRLASLTRQPGPSAKLWTAISGRQWRTENLQSQHVDAAEIGTCR